MNLSNSLYLLIFLLCSCVTPQTTQEKVIQKFRDKLSLSGEFSAEELKGGLSGASIYKITNNETKYIYRSFAHKNEKGKEYEVELAQLAADDDYGPQIFYADKKQGLLIMEYLEAKKFSANEIQTEEFYIKLAELLRKIHKGKKADRPHHKSIELIQNKIKAFKNDFTKHIPLKKLKDIISQIEQGITPYLTTTQCHNDLHGGNLIYQGEHFKAIDFEEAGPGYPYYDIATVLSYFLVSEEKERILLKHYHQRELTKADDAKLFLMKQMILIKWSLDSLFRLKDSKELVDNYSKINAPSFSKLVKKIHTGEVDLNKEEGQIILLKSLIHHILNNYDNKKIQNSLKVLKES